MDIGQAEGSIAGEMLANCANEPIHLSGAIQPHGALLAFNHAGLLVGWSANAPDMLRLALDVGARQDALFLDPELLLLIEKCRLEMANGDVVPMALSAQLGGRDFDCIAHGYLGILFVEFEVCTQPPQLVAALTLTGQSAIARLKRQTSVDTLLQMGVAQIRAITGFDRVMAYRFREDDCGEVVAEDHADGLISFLGQRYPASDIPPQARRLYTLNTLRIVADAHYDPVALLPADSGRAFDLSHSVLRSVSPVHVEYLKNMGVNASMSVSIVINGRLWGLVACHHATARQVPYAIRMICDLLAQMMAATAQSLETQAELAVIEEAACVRAGILETLQGEGDVLQALSQHAPALNHVLKAEAIVFAHHGEVICSDDISQTFGEMLVQNLPEASDVILQRTNVNDWPEPLRPHLSNWVGVLGLCFDPPNKGWVLALRREQIELVRWGGRPVKSITVGPLGPRLTPRGSFDEWCEIVRGKCRPWDAVAISSVRQLLGEVHRLRNAELTRRATHDVMTGLPNRALIRERIASALLRSRRLNLEIALLFVDLDGFKLVNDTHGHSAGDLLLLTVSDRLTRLTGPGDTVARLAGDEFVILCEHVQQPKALAALADRINSALREPVDYKGALLFVTASIGIAIGRGDSHSADDLLLYADAAMYAVKKNGRDGNQFFNENVRVQVQEHIKISNGLRTALSQEELSVRYQPIVTADSGRIVGAELLLRWSPPGGEVSPAIFIPIAEMTRVIVPIGNWVFERACEAEVAWRLRWGLQAPYVTVNLSVRQLNDDALPGTFATALKKSGADPTRIHVEVTETALMVDVEANVRVLQCLADLGLCVAVDDFGTGYSSLAQLTRLPLDVLKIDRAFIEGIDKSPESRTVVRAIIGLGHALGLKIIAEGVETAAQQIELCAYGCNFIQGYYFYRPMFEDAFIDAVDAERLNGPSGAIAALHCLIYVSEANYAMTVEEVQVLIAQSQAFNKSMGVTGCLLYQDGLFMQMLEGAEATISGLFERIKTDPRHHSVQIVMQSKAHRRIFTGWSMVLRDLRDLREDFGKPDFSSFQQRALSFKDLGEDARTCYRYITGYVPEFVIY